MSGTVDVRIRKPEPYRSVLVKVDSPLYEGWHEGYITYVGDWIVPIMGRKPQPVSRWREFPRFD